MYTCVHLYKLYAIKQPLQVNNPCFLILNKPGQVGASRRDKNFVFLRELTLLS